MNTISPFVKCVFALFFVYLLILLPTMIGCHAITRTDSSKEIAATPQEVDAKYLKASSEDMQWWREARFGMFVHWGPATLSGKEISWSRDGRRPGWEGNAGKSTPAEIYDNLYKEFNPVRFDATQWVALAKASGMKYLIFTAKHHDGFSMFDSSLADYKITNSPFKRDVVAELAKACHKAGLPLGFYYSPMDWYHPDCKTQNHANYIKYMHGQLQELCGNYGKVSIIWFDSGHTKSSDWDSENLFKKIRQHQPDIIINNRCGLPGDYDTPEQEVGQFQTDRPWESCITIGTQWSWRPNDNIKSLRLCIRTLVKCAGGDGNLLFNVGPMPDGQIEPQQVARLKEVGYWLKKYGTSIYGTRGGPFKPDSWGASTCKGKKVYLHILDGNWVNGKVILPPINKKIVSCSLLTGGKVEVTQTDKMIYFSVPPENRQDLDTIIVIKLDGEAADVKVGELTQTPT